MQSIQDLFSKGMESHRAGDLSEAERLYSEVLQADPFHFSALHMMGLLALQAGNNTGAADLIWRALEAQPENAQAASAYSDRAAALRRAGKIAEAIASCDAAIALNPRLADAHYNRGLALAERSFWQDAMSSYQRAIAADPLHGDAWHNMGLLHRERKQYGEAAACFDHARRSGFSAPFFAGLHLHAKMQICDWSDIAQSVAAALESLTSPFVTLTITDDPAKHLRSAKEWVRINVGRAPAADLPRINITNRKLRIGYFSYDFRAHPVSRLLAGVIENHDREAFEVIAFSYSDSPRDEMRCRLERAFDVFLDVSKKTDAEVVDIARAMPLDIAIDLGGHTTGARSGLFARRVAPIQVNFLGYPGTSAIDAMDYIVADDTVIPSDDYGFYTERVLSLPDTYQPNDDTRAMLQDAASKADEGLPETGFVFCCFNNGFKILPEIFASWMRILRSVDGSVLWLMREPTAENNLRAEAERHWIDGSRLVFAQKKPLAEHIARCRHGDLFLDTWPYNAHTTASDALFAGVPLLTLRGDSFPSRVAASLVAAVGLHELIVTTRADYERMAISLASDAPRLHEMRQKLLRNGKTHPLFDTKRYTRNLEAAYSKIAERNAAGLTPDHIQIGRSHPAA